MVLRKITIDNSVRYIPKSQQTKKRESKPIMMKKKQIEQNQPISGGGKPNTRRQNKNI